MVRVIQRSRFFCLLLVACVAMPLHALPHRSSRSLRTEIIALEQQWRQAALSGDIQAMDHLLSEDYLGINANGEVVTKLQMLDRMRSRDFRIAKLEVSDVKIKLISHHAAIVTSLVQVEGTADGRPIQGRFRYLRVYQRLPSSSWKITNFETTRVPKRLVANADEKQ